MVEIVPEYAAGSVKERSHRVSTRTTLTSHVFKRIQELEVLRAGESISVSLIIFMFSHLRKCTHVATMLSSTGERLLSNVTFIAAFIAMAADNGAGYVQQHINNKATRSL